MRALAAGAGLMLLLAACTTSSPEDQAQPAAEASSAPPAEAQAPPPPAPAPMTPASRTPARDACGAAELQGLIGHPRTEVPVPIDPNRQRVACTSCPVTQDYRPERLNFFFDAQTGIIKEIRCG